MHDEFNNPFKKLQRSGLKLPDADERPGRPRKAAPKPPPEPAQNPYGDQFAEEDALFLRAMGERSRAASPAPGKAKAKAAPLEHRPFGELLEEDEKRRAEEAAAPLRETAPAKQAPPRPEAPTPPAPLDEEDAEAFFSAMDGVAPMDGKGRDLPKATEPPAPPKAKDPDALAREHLRDLVRGDVEFQLEFTDEYQHGHVLGLDPKLFNKLRAGAYSTEAHLDLHGMTSDQALLAVVDFVRASYIMGKRHLLLVTGRGKNSPDGRGVLRDEVQAWLTRDPLRRVVLAFVTAQPRDGGAGALYVLLRKFKKSLGKVQWDRLPKDWSDLV
ncbi:Smr/MutS family protein [Desulfocurvus sp. DL9XJH121]